MKERVLRIGKPTPLVSIATDPSDFDANKPAVIILNSGVMHHIGTCRTSVMIAREIAKRGYLSLRFDFSGIGDSDQRRGTGNFIESSTSETKEVMDYLEKKRGIKRFVLYGLCSGADVSYETAKLDDRVVGIIQVDPYCYRTPFWYLRHYGPRLWDINVWIRFFSRLTQKAKPRGSIQDIDEEFIELPSYIREFPPQTEVAEGLTNLANRGVHMYSIFTFGQASILNHPSQFKSSFSSVPFNDLLSVEYYDDMEHIITERKYQKIIPNKIADWVKDVF
ncbi:MAG: alpha/beta hydrolase [Pseudomonadales bacterium]|nr:alpha/beta hydrolase [Pseudomonadales bacterium]